MAKRKLESHCRDCNVMLHKDVIALSLKLFGEDMESLYCLNCMKIIVGCGTDDLIVKIQEFKEQGCTLFL